MGLKFFIFNSATAHTLRPLCGIKTKDITREQVVSPDSFHSPVNSALSRRAKLGVSCRVKSSNGFQ